jgi:hypothetical protein
MDPGFTHVLLNSDYLLGHKKEGSNSMPASQKDILEASTASETDSQILLCMTIIDYSILAYKAAMTNCKDSMPFIGGI